MSSGIEVKICGVTNVADARFAAALGADFVGLVMAESRRRVEPRVAREVVLSLPLPTRPVLLFRDQPPALVVERVAETGVDLIQLHGDEDVDYVAALAGALPRVGIIRAWELRTADSGAALREHVRRLAASAVRLFRVILDAPKDAGPTADERFRELEGEWPEGFPPLWRAGGLTPENVAAALKDARYVGVDVARGVEAAPGRKDPEKLRRFIEAARGAPARR